MVRFNKAAAEYPDLSEEEKASAFVNGTRAEISELAYVSRCDKPAGSGRSKRERVTFLACLWVCFLGSESAVGALSSPLLPLAV